MSLEITQREGLAAEASISMPHHQVTQRAPIELQEELWARMIGLPHVFAGRSSVSVPQSRALYLETAFAQGDPLAFVGNSTEFVHLHGHEDGSLHLSLPEAEARHVIEMGWGELHPIVKYYGYPPVLLMIYGPRNQQELETVWSLVQRSYSFAAEPANALI